MILRKEISEKAQLWGVPPDTVDKDWILGHFIAALYQYFNHRDQLLFKGGTSIRKCRIPGYRFSEDLDFTAIEKNYLLSHTAISEICEIASNSSGALFHIVEVRELLFNNTRTGYMAKIKYWGANHSKTQSPPPPERWLTSIKLEAILYEQIVFEPEKMKLIHPYSDSANISDAYIPCYHINEIIAEKFRALIQRSYTAPRDFYDIWALKDQIQEDQWSLIYTAFREKMKFKNLSYRDTDQILNEKNTRILHTAWENSLKHQVKTSNFPEIYEVTDSIREILEHHFK